MTCADDGYFMVQRLDSLPSLAAAEEVGSASCFPQAI